MDPCDFHSLGVIENLFDMAISERDEEPIYSILHYTKSKAMNFSEVLSMFRQGKGNAKSHMKNLIEMAAADGHFHDTEFDLLKIIGKRNGISESQLKEIRSNSNGIQFEIPADKKEKFHQLYDLVHMMSIDNAIHPEEQKLCEIFATKFGYSPRSIGDLISTIRANIKNGQSHDETMKRVDMLLN